MPVGNAAVAGSIGPALYATREPAPDDSDPCAAPGTAECREIAAVSARFFDLLDVAAAVLHAQAARAELLGRLLDQERRLALRAGLGDGSVPERELAVRIAV